MIRRARPGPRLLAALPATLSALALAACGVSGTSSLAAASSSGGSASSSGGSAGVGANASGGRAHRRHHRRRHERPGSSHKPPSTPAGLVYSAASNTVVQPQPPAGSCHALASGLYSRPDPSCTPGALNPAVTQATIRGTICASGWTSTVRPPESVTEAEKARSMTAYGDRGPISDYEYDHFIPLELGGATNDPRNLWPEPGASPNPKDAVEDRLREEVCAGEISLARAQHEIAANWTALAGAPKSSGGGSGASPRAGTPSGARCTVDAAWSSRYQDYDVYVHSNQPDQTVTVSDAAGRSRSWHTDSSGYADVYFKAGASASGEHITVRVGAATCSGTL